MSTPMQQVTKHVEAWDGASEEEAINQLDSGLRMLANDPALARLFVVGLGNQAWLWREWPKFIAEAESHLDALEPKLPPTTKGWGRWSK